MSKNPLVSVSIITYNHKDFIAVALESVLRQKVDFEYEIIVGDDFSTDGTQDIIKAYQQKYPDKIQLILHPRDYDCIPGRINNITNLYACRGKYIAMLDGDDAWISKNKLQEQVNFLENHDDFVLTFHEMVMNYDGEQELLYTDEFAKRCGDVFTYEDVISDWFIQTSSLVFRNHLLGEFPEWFWEVYSADYAIQMLISRYGKVKFFPELVGQRNFHAQSFSATQNITEEHRDRRRKEQEIFSENFPGYEVYKNYEFAKESFKLGRKGLNMAKNNRGLGQFFKAMFYSGLFITGRKIPLSRKIAKIKGDIEKSKKSKI